MLRTLIVLTLGAAAFAAPAAQRTPDRAEARLAKRLVGLVPGPPQDCINVSHSDGSSHAGNTVLIKDRYGTLYRSQFQNGCTADEDDSLILRTTSTQLCRGEIVQVRDLTSGFDSGACVYGDFVPYKRP